MILQYIAAVCAGLPKLWEKLQLARTATIKADKTRSIVYVWEQRTRRSKKGGCLSG